MSATLITLTSFIAWTLLLLIVMEAIRTKIVLTKELPANAFMPDNANLSPFMRRLTRAHLNCLEGLPIFGGLMLVAEISGRSHLTDPLAYNFLAARIAQSTIHVVSVSSVAVVIRFCFFAVQMTIGAYWSFLLLTA